MKKYFEKKIAENKITVTVVMPFVLLSAVLLFGCGQSKNQEKQISSNTGDVSQESPASDGNSVDNSGAQDEKSDDMGQASETELEVCFGDEGKPFMLQLNGSDTAAAIVRHVGTSDWRLPIYEDDEDADYDVMEYYDIPSRYDIPSAPEKITSVKAGEVYYSDPNRIVLYFKDAEVSEEYTPVGHFDATDEFVEAVKDNPVLEGWGNKIVIISKP